MDNFNHFNYKIIKKNNIISIMDKHYLQLPWNKGIFLTHSTSKKKLPYGSFFLHTKIFGHNTFCIALHMINMDNFNYKITDKNNLFSFMDKQYRQLPWNIRTFFAHSKRKKKLLYGSFFLRTKTFGHNTFCIALHLMKINNFNLS